MDLFFAICKQMISKIVLFLQNETFSADNQKRA